MMFDFVTITHFSMITGDICGYDFCVENAVAELLKRCPYPHTGYEATIGEFKKYLLSFDTISRNKDLDGEFVQPEELYKFFKWIATFFRHILQGTDFFTPTGEVVRLFQLCSFLTSLQPDVLELLMTNSECRFDLSASIREGLKRSDLEFLASNEQNQKSMHDKIVEVRSYMIAFDATVNSLVDDFA